MPSDRRSWCSVIARVCTLLIGLLLVGCMNTGEQRARLSTTTAASPTPAAVTPTSEQTRDDPDDCI